jgi:excisionase family DNA binding protein
MSEPGKIFSDLFRDELKEILRGVVREELAGTDGNGRASPSLLMPEELADRLKVPLSWVYEQSRQGNIPTHRIGRYIRFSLKEVMDSQKKRD